MNIMGTEHPALARIVRPYECCDFCVCVDSFTPSEYVERSGSGEGLDDPRCRGASSYVTYFYNRPGPRSGIPDRPSECEYKRAGSRTLRNDARPCLVRARDRGPSGRDRPGG